MKKKILTTLIADYRTFIAKNPVSNTAQFNKVPTSSPTLEWISKNLLQEPDLKKLQDDDDIPSEILHQLRIIVLKYSPAPDMIDDYYKAKINTHANKAIAKLKAALLEPEFFQKIWPSNSDEQKTQTVETGRKLLEHFAEKMTDEELNSFIPKIASLPEDDIDALSQTLHFLQKQTPFTNIPNNLIDFFKCIPILNNHNLLSNSVLRSIAMSKDPTPTTLSEQIIMLGPEKILTAETLELLLQKNETIVSVMQFLNACPNLQIDDTLAKIFTDSEMVQNLAACANAPELAEKAINQLRELELLTPGTLKLFFDSKRRSFGPKNHDSLIKFCQTHRDLTKDKTVQELVIKYIEKISPEYLHTEEDHTADTTKQKDAAEAMQKLQKLGLLTEKTFLFFLHQRADFDALVKFCNAYPNLTQDKTVQDLAIKYIKEIGSLTADQYQTAQAMQALQKFGLLTEEAFLLFLQQNKAFVDLVQFCQLFQATTPDKPVPKFAIDYVKEIGSLGTEFSHAAQAMQGLQTLGLLTSENLDLYFKQRAEYTACINILVQNPELTTPKFLPKIWRMIKANPTESSTKLTEYAEFKTNLRPSTRFCTQKDFLVNHIIPCLGTPKWQKIKGEYKLGSSHTFEAKVPQIPLEKPTSLLVEHSLFTTTRRQSIDGGSSSSDHFRPSTNPEAAELTRDRSASQVPRMQQKK